MSTIVGSNRLILGHLQSFVQYTETSPDPLPSPALCWILLSKKKNKYHAFSIEFERERGKCVIYFAKDCSYVPSIIFGIMSIIDFPGFKMKKLNISRNSEIGKFSWNQERFNFQKKKWYFQHWEVRKLVPNFFAKLNLFDIWNKVWYLKIRLGWFRMMFLSDLRFNQNDDVSIFVYNISTSIQHRMLLWNPAKHNCLKHRSLLGFQYHYCYFCEYKWFF